jgi:hypothetical protein
VYVAQTDLLAFIPSQFLIDAMDDNGDGVADPGVWDGISADVDIAVDSILDENKVVLPLVPPYPEPVISVARFMALDRLYLRRGVQPGEHNPWNKRLRDAMEALHEWCQKGASSTGGPSPEFRGRRPHFQHGQEDGI